MINPSEIKEQLIKNSFWSIISSIINRVGGFVLIILLSRLLMPEGFGKYSLVMTISLFFITFSDFGINQTLLRYVSLGIDKKNNEAASYLQYLFKIKFLIVAVFTLVLGSLSYPLSFVFKDESLFMLILIISIYVFFTSLMSFFEFLFFIKKYVKYVSTKEFFSLLLKLAAIFFISLFINQEFQITGIFISFVIISFLSLLFVLHFSKKVYPSLFEKKIFPINKKELSRFIFFINVQNISLLILSQASIIILGVFASPELVGYYNSSWALIMGITSLIFSFSCMFLPIFTNVSKEIFPLVLKKIFRISFIFALPISFGLSFLSKFFIIQIYGQDYLPASVSLSILAFLIPIIAGTDIAIASFSARNKQRKFSMIIFLSALIFIFLNFLIFKFFPIESNSLILVAISIINILSWSFFFLCTIYLIKREFNVNIFSSYLLKSLFSCFIMSLFIIFVNFVLGDMNLFFGIVTILCSIIIYFISLFLTKEIKKEDMSLIKDIFQRR